MNHRPSSSTPRCGLKEQLDLAALAAAEPKVNSGLHGPVRKVADYSRAVKTETCSTR